MEGEPRGGKRELPAAHADVRRKQARMPKLYFSDTGLLCHLLGIDTWEALRDSDRRMDVYENMLVAEARKRRFAEGLAPNQAYYMDEYELQLTLLDLTDPGRPEYMEMKYASWWQDVWTGRLNRVGDLLGVGEGGRNAVWRGRESKDIGGIRIWTAHDWMMRE